jgi:hypothetical protein
MIYVFTIFENVLPRGTKKALSVQITAPNCPWWFTKSGENVVSTFLLLSGIKVATQLVGLEKSGEAQKRIPRHFFTIFPSLNLSLQNIPARA